MLLSPSREAEERCEAGGECGGSERKQVIIKVGTLGNEDMGGDA